MKMSLLLFGALGSLLVWAGETFKVVPRTPEILHAERYGAEAKVVFKVVDDEGQPVSNAVVSSVFNMNRPLSPTNQNPQYKSFTDSDGRGILTGKTVVDISYGASKIGYYSFHGTHWFSTQKKRGAVIDGKWQPYGLEVLATLKRIRNPIRFRETNVRHKNLQVFPKTEEFVGFDIQVNDWMPPYGKGRVCDFELGAFPEKEKSDPYYRGMELKIRFVRKFDGAYIKDYDVESFLQTDYSVDTNALSGEDITFSSFSDPKTGRLRENVVRDKSYMVLRTRSKIDAAGKFCGGQYARSYGHLGVGFAVDQETDKPFVRMNFLVNPNFDDTNLECLNGWHLRLQQENPKFWDGASGRK